MTRSFNALCCYAIEQNTNDLYSNSFLLCFSDDIRDLNGHADDEIKRQRLHYGSDQLYSVSC